MLSSPLTRLDGIGPKKALILHQEAGIETLEDLLYYSPRKYLDRSTIKKIRDCFTNETVSIIGEIVSVKVKGGRKRFLEVEISDDTDSLTGVFFGGVQYFQKIFHPGEEIIFSGKINFRRGKQIVHPDFDFIEETSSLQTINTAGIIPLYRSTEKLRNAGLDSRGFRRLFRQVMDNHLPEVIDSLPEYIIQKYNLLSLKDALFNIHFPRTFREAEAARKRLAFNELFFLFFYLQYSKKIVQSSANGITFNDDRELLPSFIDKLPFNLTPDQEKAILRISENLRNPVPMNRLLQGDVGSGKTVVALAAAIIAISSGYQVALMAPTAVLATQHYRTIIELIPGAVKSSLLTGHTGSEERERILNNLNTGELDLICGTHALIQETVQFSRLGLIIIDEQHKFGVNQRADLRRKGDMAHLLVMTATPIPRSLAMTVYGDLEISTIKSMPANRPARKTLALPESRLHGVYNSIKKYIDQKRQVYYILPLIEESEKSDLKAAITVFEHLRDSVFPGNNIDLLHGKIKQPEKDNIMAKFKNGETDILVSTTVVEVGVDVPNATVIIIQHPERFGLSQLHQLRGRVGRGIHESFCVLLYPDELSEESLSRIKILEKTDDGFEIAEEDLKTRGAGQLIGTRQHGMSDFEFTNLIEDLDIITSAREEAEKEVDALGNLPKDDKILNYTGSSELTKHIRQKKILEIMS